MCCCCCCCSLHRICKLSYCCCRWRRRGRIAKEFSVTVPVPVSFSRVKSSPEGKVETDINRMYRLYSNSPWSSGLRRNQRSVGRSVGRGRTKEHRITKALHQQYNNPSHRRISSIPFRSSILLIFCRGIQPTYCPAQMRGRDSQAFVSKKFRKINWWLIVSVARLALRGERHTLQHTMLCNGDRLTEEEEEERREWTN